MHQQAKARREILARDPLETVFNYMDRFEIDNHLVVSNQFDVVAGAAKPLRAVERVSLHRNPFTQLFTVEVVYRQYPSSDSTHRAAEEQKAIHGADTEVFIAYADIRKRERTFESAAEAIKFFLNCLRFSHVTRWITLSDIYIDRAFIDHLRSIRANFKCNDQLISVRKVQFSDWVDPFDVLSALPNYRTLTDNTLELLGSMRLVNDAFLRELAQRGILHHRGWLHDGRHITTAGILDYSFGNYAHDGRGRRLQVHAPQVCDDFLSKLIEASHECASMHKLVLIVMLTKEPLFDSLHGEREQTTNDDGTSAVIFHVRGQPNLYVKYTLADGCLVFERNL